MKSRPCFGIGRSDRGYDRDTGVDCSANSCAEAVSFCFGSTELVQDEDLGAARGRTFQQRRNIGETMGIKTASRGLAAELLRNLETPPRRKINGGHERATAPMAGVLLYDPADVDVIGAQQSGDAGQEAVNGEALLVADRGELHSIRRRHCNIPKLSLLLLVLRTGRPRLEFGQVWIW